MDTGALYGFLIGLTLAVSAATGVVLARGTHRWLADDEQLELLTRSRSFRRWWLVAGGIVIAAVAVLLFPSASVLAAETGWSAYAPRSGATFAPPTANALDPILLSLSLGTAAAATPFLFVVDILVHRLPDRIVYPLIGVELLICIVGAAFGGSRIWVLGLIAGGAAALFFGILHLIGRLLHARTMGLGDVKLAFIVFLTPTLFSPWAPALVFVIMMLIAGAAALIAAASRRSLAGTTIAFGPAMLSGMWFGAVLSPILL